MASQRIANMLVDRIGRKIVAVGRNYLSHAKEMGDAAAAARTDPILFLKPTSSYVREPGPILLPRNTEVHHELELGVIIGSPGGDIAPGDAHKHIAGYACCLDLTARNLQAEAKKQGLPWTVSKGYDTFLPVSSTVPLRKIFDPANLQLYLHVNGQLKQTCNTKDMIWPIDDLISYISTIMYLEEGDLILTGTPEGVGPLKPGDELVAGIKDHVEMRFTCEERPLPSWQSKKQGS